MAVIRRFTSANPWRRAVLLLGAMVVLGMLALTACGDDDTTDTGTRTTGPTGTAAAASGSRSGSAVEACPPSGSAKSLNGAGATFPNPLYSDWFQRYADLCGVQVNYQSIGSGGGIQQITAKTVDFGASDGILNADQKAAAPGPIHMIPMTSDAVAVVFNLDGVGSGDITLDGTTLANIFLGKIKKWNDPAIGALNSDASLPDEDITVVHRSDGSGTTFIFTNYLSKVSADWKSGPGNATSVNWPTGVGGQGNEGVASQVKQLPGSIGYISLGYVKANDIAYAKMKNSSGAAIEPSTESTRAAAEGVTLPENMEIMITDSANPGAYPISGFTWLLVYAQQEDRAKSITLGHLIHWMLTDAQQYSEALDYVPLSSAATEKALAELAATTYQGTPITELK